MGLVMIDRTLEQMFGDFIYTSVKDSFIDIVMEDKGDTIRKIVSEELSDDRLRDWIKDFIAYDDELRDNVRTIVSEQVAKKLPDIVQEALT